MVYVRISGNFILTDVCQLAFIFLQLQSIYCGETTVNMSEKEYHDFENCTLRPASEKIGLKLEKIISDDNRLIQLDITVEWKISTPHDTYLSPKEWFMTTSGSGQLLLLLPDHFSEMSLGTLPYNGIAKLHVTLKQEPEDCLVNLTIDDAEYILKYVLLTLPSNLETRNEEGISKLQICNGTRDSFGDCCALTLTENDIICKSLKQDRWGNAIKWMFVIITVIFLLQSVSFIPKDMYEKSKKETFTLSDTTAKMQIKVTDNLPSSEVSWDKRPLLGDDNLSNFFEKLNDHMGHTASGDTFTVRFKVNNITSTVDTKQLHSELFPSSGILKFLYDSYRDLLRLRKSSEYYCPCVSFLTCFWSVVDKMLLALLFIMLFVLFTLRILFLVRYTSDISFYLMCLSLLPVTFYYILYFPLSESRNWKELFQKSLRETFETQVITENKSKGYPISSGIDFINYMKAYFPLLQFLFMALSNIWHSKSCLISFICFLMIVLGGLLNIFVLVVDCVLFYVECFFCTMLGLILNYDKVVQYVLIFLIVVKYAYDSISDVENKIRLLTISLFKIIRELCADTNAAILLQGNVESGNLSRFALCKCGSVYWLPRGVIVFNKLIKPENILIKHLSKKFTDDISCLSGHLTAGSKYSLLFVSCKEIASVILILFLVLNIVLEFGNVKDLSSSVLTVVTFVTGTTVSSLVKLCFKDTEYDADDDVHLSKLIKYHLAEYEEPWIIKDFDFDIMTCERTTEQNMKETDISIVVERRDEQINACYIKPLGQKNSFNWDEAQNQLI